jgi:hypothetical protein
VRFHPVFEKLKKVFLSFGNFSSAVRVFVTFFGLFALGVDEDGCKVM